MTERLELGICYGQKRGKLRNSIIRKIMKHLRTPEDVVEGLAMLALTSIEEVRAVKEEFRR